jgi:hypothetical protein
MVIGFLFGVTAKDVLKGIHKPALPVYKCMILLISTCFSGRVRAHFAAGIG